MTVPDRMFCQKAPWAPRRGVGVPNYGEDLSISGSGVLRQISWIQRRGVGARPQVSGVALLLGIGVAAELQDGARKNGADGQGRTADHRHRPNLGRGHVAAHDGHAAQGGAGCEVSCVSLRLGHQSSCCTAQCSGHLRLRTPRC